MIPTPSSVATSMITATFEPSNPGCLWLVATNRPTAAGGLNRGESKPVTSDAYRRYYLATTHPPTYRPTDRQNMRSGLVGRSSRSRRLLRRSVGQSAMQRRTSHPTPGRPTFLPHTSCSALFVRVNRKRRLYTELVARLSRDCVVSVCWQRLRRQCTGRWLRVLEVIVVVWHM